MRVLAVSPEPADVISAFTSEHGITYPVLADADSSVIRSFGILSTLIEPDEPLYGLPFPGSYLTDASGHVTAKFFNRRYQEREAPEIVFHDGLALPVDTSGHPAAKDEAGISAVLASPTLTFQQKTAIMVRIDLPAGLHVYGQPIPSGYVPTTVSIRGPETVEIGEPIYPATKPFKVDGLDEQFFVFEGDVEIEVPILSSEHQSETVQFEIAVGYQACDDKTCFLPQTVNLTLEAPVKGVNRAARRT